jgi:decaprenylphospho-beta-D-ribofuranose 2-oxidase
MPMNHKSFFNWGRNKKIYPQEILPKKLLDLKKAISKKSFITAGNQRSFGDVALNDKLIISMRNFNKVIHFNEKKGIIELESGILLKEILPLIVEKNWIFPVTPGTKYVSIGGMVANNINGKNSQKNQIKFYIKNIKLLTPNKKIILCSSKKNKKIFDLTIGGFGLTGIILSATIQLKKISSFYMKQEILEFNTYNDFYKIAKKTDNFDYSVSWVDNFTNNKISGLWFFSNHANIRKNYKSFKIFNEKKIGIIWYLILALIVNVNFFSRLFNYSYKTYKKTFYKEIVQYDQYFYPQDYFIDWNKAYGKKGMFQVQFLVPKEKFKDILSEIHLFFKQEGIFSSFIVIKKINEKGKYLNFSGKGYSVSLDFTINSKFNLIKKFLNETFRINKLKVNFAKDFISNETNANNYKEFKKFKRDLLSLNKGKKLNSSFSKRINI